MEFRRDKLPTSGFYTYVHCRPDGTPFYVGKGSGGVNNSRAYDFTVSRNPAYANCLAKHGQGNIHVRIYPRDSEAEAFEFERYLINTHRACGFKLHNLAEGGRGGTAGVSPSPESNLKRSNALRGVPLKPGHAEKIGDALRGRSHTEDAKLNFKRGQAKRFANMSDEEKQELAAPLRNRVRSPEEVTKRSAALKAAWVIRKQRAKISAEKGVSK